jgi:hypothetical protein
LFGFRKEVTVASYIPKKRKNVILISSSRCDDTSDRETGDQIVTFYNGIKSGINIVDQMFSTNNVARYLRRWPLVMFYAMLKLSGINAQVIYMGNKNEVMSR